MSGLMTDLSLVRTVLSTSSAFQAWSGTANPTAALAKILYFASDTTSMPCAVLAYGAGWNREVVTLDQEFFTSPQVMITFAKAVTKSDSDATVFNTLTTAIDGIMADIEENTTWRIQSWQPDSETTPERASHSASTDLVAFSILLNGNLRS